MIKFLLIFIPQFALALDLPPAPFPVFLKAGFSSILEFDEAPVRVVLGDPQSFQVEKIDKSIAVKTLVPYGTSDMFVYFKSAPPRLFVLSASEDATPTYYKRFDPIVKPKPLAASRPISYHKSLRLISAHFDKEKDYLTVDAEITADSSSVLKPRWDLVRLLFNQRALTPEKLWSERQDVQKDSRVKSRFIFRKPNLPRNMAAVKLVIPIAGFADALTISLRGSK